MVWDISKKLSSHESTHAHWTKSLNYVKLQWNEIKHISEITFIMWYDDLVSEKTYIEIKTLSKPFIMLYVDVYTDAFFILKENLCNI